MDQTFLNDAVSGLRSEPKRLPSKYFYDAKGDELFRKIMRLPEYYLTDCEHEILSDRGTDILNTVYRNADELNILELGAGDGYKTKILLEKAREQKRALKYIPVDISENILEVLVKDLKNQFPELNVAPKPMDYFDALRKTQSEGNAKNLILFLGSTVGNLLNDERNSFFKSLSGCCKSGDELLIGFDLQKDPLTILAAYNDESGITRDFNLNLISRLQNELKLNVSPEQFYHYPSYDPIAGTARSFLVPKENITLKTGNERIELKKGEPIHCENSRKFTLKQIEEIAKDFGFKVVNHFTDSREYFADSLWRKI